MLRTVLIGLNLAALSCAAFAESADTGEAPSPEQRAEDQGLQEVIVTAQRREESSQRTALAIQAISSEELARSGVTRPEDLAAVATGVQVGVGGNIPQVYIRGVGNYATNNFSESAVAFNLDGVYVSRGWATRGAYFDLDRVEVLKGPQGTLYGRNASGGAINLISAVPRLGETSGYFEGEGGNYNLASGTGAINVPFGETFALRLAGQYINRDGYLDSGYDDEKSQSVRLQALYRPNDNFSTLLRVSYSRNDGNGAGETPTTGYGNNPWMGSSNEATSNILHYPFGGNPATGQGFVPLLTEGQLGRGYLDNHVYGVSADLTWDAGFGTLTLIPAYRSGAQRDLFYVTDFSIQEAESDHQSSVEVRLSNQTDRLKWVLGGYYFNEDQANLAGQNMNYTDGNISGQVIPPDFHDNIASAAAFGQATYSLIDTFRLTAGLRYTHEHKTEDGQLVSYAGPNGPGGSCIDPFAFNPLVGQPASPVQYAACVANVPLADKTNFNKFTYKGGFEYDLAERSMLYGNVSTGFKSGGFYAGFPGHDTFKPETVKAYDVGVKNRFFNNRLQVNLEGFYWRYVDEQVSHLGYGGVPNYYTFVTDNASRATSFGGELDVDFLPTPADKVGVSVQYDRSKYDDFTYFWETPIFGAPNVGCQVGALNPATGTQAVNCSGKQLFRTPTWTGNASYEHTFDLASGAAVTGAIRSQFSSSYYLSVEYVPNELQSGFGLVDADLTYTSPNKRWSITAWGRNLGNKAVFDFGYQSPYVKGFDPYATSPYGLVEGALRPPRTYGVRARVNL